MGRGVRDLVITNTNYTISVRGDGEGSELWLLRIWCPFDTTGGIGNGVHRPRRKWD